MYSTTPSVNHGDVVTVFTVVVTAVVTEAWQGDMSDQLLLISRGVKLQSWLLSN